MVEIIAAATATIIKTAAATAIFGRFDTKIRTWREAAPTATAKNPATRAKIAAAFEMRPAPQDMSGPGMADAVIGKNAAEAKKNVRNKTEKDIIVNFGRMDLRVFEFLVTTRQNLSVPSGFSILVFVRS